MISPSSLSLTGLLPSLSGFGPSYLKTRARAQTSVGSLAFVLGDFDRAQRALWDVDKLSGVSELMPLLTK